MATERESYTEEFKWEAVRLMETSSKPITSIACDLAVNDNNLYPWRGLYGRQPQAVTNDSSGDVAELEAELKRLRRENGAAAGARHSKKAMRIVSRSKSCATRSSRCTARPGWSRRCAAR